MCDPRSCYHYQYELCNSLGPASTSNRKFFAPYNPVYYEPFNEYIYPVQHFKFLKPGTIEYLRKRREEEQKNKSN